MSENKAYEAFMQKVYDQTVYFMNSYERAVIKSVPGQGFWVKFNGQKEFKAVAGSSVVIDGLHEHNEITEKLYNSF